jgi:hypothetical protein
MCVEVLVWACLREGLCLCPCDGLVLWVCALAVTLRVSLGLGVSAHGDAFACLWLCMGHGAWGVGSMKHGGAREVFGHC